jgi:hypothetical protein
LLPQLAEVQALLKKMADAGKAGSDRYVKAQAVEKDISDLLNTTASNCWSWAPWPVCW